jgi:hypothetical protein
MRQTSLLLPLLGRGIAYDLRWRGTDAPPLGELSAKPTEGDFDSSFDPEDARK